MGEMIDKFVALYDELGIDFEHVELETCQFLIFIPSDKIIIRSGQSFIKFDINGNFIGQVHA